MQFKIYNDCSQIRNIKTNRTVMNSDKFKYKLTMLSTSNFFCESVCFNGLSLGPTYVHRNINKSRQCTRYESKSILCAQSYEKNMKKLNGYCYWEVPLVHHKLLYYVCTC